MNKTEASNEWPVLGPDDPPLDWTRENAAYEKERERLVREHCGKIALIHDDQFVGVFPNVDEALFEGCRRFGLVKMMFKEIRASEAPELISHIDINHPSFQRLD
jgi:hypothetical protein